MPILKLCRSGKVCKRNLIKSRGTEIQKHIENTIKHKIELSWKIKIALTLFIKYNFISDVRNDSEDARWNLQDLPIPGTKVSQV